MGLVWRPQLSVGNDLIDRDHQYLIFIINKADKAVTEGNRDKLRQTLAELASYAKRHFAREEMIAEAISYPHTRHLHAEHDALATALDQQQTELCDGYTEAKAAAFMQFLKSWLIEHVIKEDMLMKPRLTQYPPKFDPTLLVA